MENAFQVGDVVVYKASGVFRIAEIGVPDFMREKRLRYFPLKDVYARNPREALYVPTGSAGLMRPVVGREQAEAYLNGFGLLEPDPGITSRSAGLTARYQAVIDTFDLSETLRLLKALYLKARSLGRSQKLLEVDIQYRDIAEKIICDEFAYALGAEPRQIRERLAGAIKSRKAATRRD